MKRTIAWVFVLCALAAGGPAETAGSEEYEGLSTLKAARVVWDVREGSPKGAAAHLALIRRTYATFSELGKAPAFAVVFSGPAVRLISTDRDEFADADRKSLDEIAATLSAMAKENIRAEFCLVAAKNFGVDPDTVLPVVRPVGNGWISLATWQAQGYALVPVY